MPKATTAKSSPRARRTKAEIQPEFSAIQDEMETARESADAKADELARVKEAEARQAVEGVTVDGVVEQISKLGLDLSRTLNGLSEKLADEVSRLATLRSAVELERKELERLHKIDVAATALDQLVQEYAKRPRPRKSRPSLTPRPHSALRTVWREKRRTHRHSA